MRQLLLTALIVVTTIAQAQQEITVKGVVSGGDGEHVFYDLMIVNRRTRSGTFAGTDGRFTTRAFTTDTLLIGAGGYVTRTVPLNEFTTEELGALRIILKPWTIDLKPVAVLPERTLKEIQADIAKLGYDPKDYRTTGVDALQSPITFLYEQFSRRERSKRQVAELQNEDRRRELLKELLHKYVEYDIINLSDESFDDFIDFCNVPEATLKGLSQYEFLIYVKKKYELYTSLGPSRQH
ncbi:MAG: hypothetical protein QM724_11665 [Flavobacteriales bacterium]